MEQSATLCDATRQIETPPFSFPTDGAATISDPFVRAAIHQAFGGICFWTRQPLAPHEMHIDHVWPKAHGGPDNIFNFVPASQHANLTKGDNIDVEALTAVLAIVRLAYGPRVLAEVKAAKQRSATLKAAWWRISERRIRPERQYLLAAPDGSLLHLIESHRVEIAHYLRNSPLDADLTPDWEGLIVGAGSDFGPAIYSELSDVRRAWLATIMAPRAGV